ncbi:MAG: hypothetical protein GY769_13625 [bacterium]|nr:hypothetical protein [bacterium]
MTSPRFSFGVLAVLALAATPRLDAEVFRVVGFGDSVTEAIGFDVGASSKCKAGDPDTCGYIPRLESSEHYGCNASTCQFVNRGRRGETTDRALTRIDAVLNEKAWDLIILMEGTNDITESVSAQTIDFNLRQMARKAKNRQIGTAQASTIWLNPTLERPFTKGRNLIGNTLGSLIASQAASARRCFVDVRSKLCPPGSNQAKCFSRNYWEPPVGQEDFVGHPNARGYDVMAKEFFRVLGSAGEPGAAEIVAPLDEACGKKASLAWRKETVAGATCGNWFRVQIDGAGGNKLNAWYQEDDVCSDSDCAVTSPVNFDQGTLSIRIQTRNTRGYGPWTAEESFTIVPSSPKKVGKLVAPSGELFSVGGLEPEFTWKPVKAAKSYRLELVSRSAGVVFDGSFDATESCEGNRCTAVLDDPLLTGEYIWRVLAENICGGTWSEPETVVVFDGPPSVAPAAVSPSSRVFDGTPTFRWNTVVGATEYEIEDAFGTSTVLAAADHCIGGVCRFTSGALAAGAYSWRVRAVNPLGAGAWSGSVAFQIANCDCFEGRAAGGSSFLLAVPENWNGDLAIWSHDSNYFGVREIEDFGQLAQRQFDEGYALGTTSYTVTGWPLFKSERDLEKVYDTFVARYGEPTNVYLFGESTGALAALAAVESAKLGNLVGALTSCGPLAGVPNWEAALDLRLAYDAICSEVIGASIPGGAKGLPKPNDLEPADIRNAVNVCTGIDSKRPQRSSEQKQRLKELLRVNDIPESGLHDAMQQATFGLYDLVRDKRKLKGRLPVGNDGVDYGSDSLNASIERAKVDPKGARKLAQTSRLSGDIKDTKVISLHTSRDSVFFPENLRNYSDLAPADGLAAGFVTEAKASHCGFSEVELLASWRALKIWAEGGKKPKPKNLQSRCQSLEIEADGECRFDTKPKFETLETRVRPRP